MIIWLTYTYFSSCISADCHHLLRGARRQRGNDVCVNLVIRPRMQSHVLRMSLQPGNYHISRVTYSSHQSYDVECIITPSAFNPTYEPFNAASRFVLYIPFGMLKPKVSRPYLKDILSTH